MNYALFASIILVVSLLTLAINTYLTRRVSLSFTSFIDSEQIENIKHIILSEPDFRMCGL